MLEDCITITQIIQMVTLETWGVDLTNVPSLIITRASIETKANAHNKVCTATVLAHVNRWYRFMKRPDVGTVRTDQIGLICQSSPKK